MDNKNINEDEYLSYETFLTTSKDGEELEMAVVDKFVFEEKHYVVAARVVDDEVDDSGLYVYRSIKAGKEITVSQIADPDEYERIANYYAGLDQ